MGGEDNKDGARRCTPSRAEGHALGEEEDCKDVSTSDSSVLRPLPRKEDSPEKEIVFGTKTLQSGG